jgi:hypothetical protein
MPLDQGRSECPIHGESFAQHFGNCTNETDEMGVRVGGWFFSSTSSQQVGPVVGSAEDR